MLLIGNIIPIPITLNPANPLENPNKKSGATL